MPRRQFVCLLLLLAPAGALTCTLTGVRAPLPAATRRASLRLAADEATGKEDNEAAAAGLALNLGAMRVAWPGTPFQAVQHLPLLAAPSLASYAALPVLYATWQAAAPNTQDKLGTFVALLLTKRLTLYACALATVYVTAMRSGDAAVGLGERLELITAEAVFPATLPEGQTAEIRVVTRQLDETPAAAQAAGLPLLFAALLASAYVSTLLLQPGAAPPTETIDTSLADGALELLRVAFATVQPLSTASVCLFAGEP